MTLLTRQILVFIAIWALLIYIFLTKLNATSADKDSDDQQKLNKLDSILRGSKSVDKDLRRIIDEYTNDISNNDSKLDLLKKINSKFQSSGENTKYVQNQKMGIPAMEYEVMRKRVMTNIEELWNFISAETKKIEKFVKAEDSQQALKKLESFVQLATEHKR